MNSKDILIVCALEIETQGQLEDYDVLYNTYLTTTKCQMCEIVLEGKGRNKKCLDHDHVSGAFRKVLCNNCNWVLMRNK